MSIVTDIFYDFMSANIKISCNFIPAGTFEKYYPMAVDRRRDLF